ncbi:MAG TPA: acyl-CoA dehydrogenase family protein [Kofleriaceae bacterium]|jgi:alkylation response protein AidB-like acyl-CoA dehydrogenase|nr:acyl-CoA dehydrogenase family protein [Kofleriaceae bacterium]
MFAWTDEHKMIRKMVRRWATDKLEPKVTAFEGGEPPYELMREFARTFGLADMVRGAFEKEGGPGGGGGRDPMLGNILAIELSRVCPGFMLAFGASMGLAGGAIMGKGTPEQKRRWALPVLTFDKIGAWGMTEPGAGSDAFRSMRTVAVPDGDGYRLNGSKTFITNAPFADILVVYAKIDRGDGTPLEDRPIQPFVIERGDAGMETSQPMRKMGMHSSPTGEIFLTDCRVPADRLLGEKEKSAVGRDSGRDVFHSERTGMAPMCVGIIERCLEVCVAYAQERVTWGKKIAEYQLVQEKLARMFMHLQNCENLMFKQMGLQAAGKSMTAAEASATKLYCARAATECAMEAVQILGGNGYMQEFRVEMLARDAKLLQIGGGTDEIQIINIARHLLSAA